MPGSATRRCTVPYSTRQLETTVTRVTRPGPLGQRAAAPRAAPGGGAAIHHGVGHPRIADRGHASVPPPGPDAGSRPRQYTRPRRSNLGTHVVITLDTALTLPACLAHFLLTDTKFTRDPRRPRRRVTVTHTIHKVTTHEVTTRESRRPCGASDRSITVASSCPAQLP